MPAAIVVIDLVNDTFAHPSRLSAAAEAMMPELNECLRAFRAKRHHIIYSTDSFMKGDFLFNGRMKPHSIRGTKGADIAEMIEQAPGDLWVPKRRFSAFYKTDLDQTLRTWGVDTVAVCGVATNFCVLATAMDSVCHDFKTAILEDLSAAMSPEAHEATLDLYRGNVLDPIFRVMKWRELLAELEE